MRGVVFTGNRNLELMEFEDPTPGPREVVLEIKASGMCGSDLHQYRRVPGGSMAGGVKRSSEPTIAGHEPCGVVAAIGAGITDKEAFIGQRVMDHHYAAAVSASIVPAAGRRCAWKARRSTAQADTGRMRNT